jgi:pyridoxamine 5'-phosphate oxidase family protein
MRHLKGKLVTLEDCFGAGSIDPWRPRGIEVRGRAEAIDGSRPLIRIHPERIVPWGLEPNGRPRTV